MERRDTSRNCPEKKKDDSNSNTGNSGARPNSNQNRRSDPNSMFVGYVGNPIEITHNQFSAQISGTAWIVDLGAGGHCSGNRSLFMNEPKPSNEVVITASGERIVVTGRGDIQVQIDVGTLKLTNVLFVPGLAVNLISVSQLNSKGISVVFGAEDAPTTFMFKNNVIAHVDKISNQFLLRNKAYSTSVEETHAFNLTKRSMDIQVWHRRFVHAPYQRIIENKKNVDGLFHHGDIPKELCEACLKGKQEASVSRIPMRKATRFLDRIHVDIGEGLPVTFRGNKYFLLIKDDATGMFFVYLMKTKDEILKQLHAFKRWSQDL